MQNEYIHAIIYTLLGLIGAIFHWAKKRYIDNTTELDLVTYLITNKKATFNVLYTIIGAEITLALNTTDFLSLNEIIGVLTVGYTADSSLNSTKES